MKNGTPRTIRNIVLASYPGAGKTSLTEALAFSAGIIPNMGSVLQGNTIGDFEPEEVHRHHSLEFRSPYNLSGRGHGFNVLDTPGMADYGVEVQSSLRAADGVILGDRCRDWTSSRDRAGMGVYSRDHESAVSSLYQ